MKIDKSVPKMTPRLMAKAKLRMLSPPKNKMQRVMQSILTINLRPINFHVNKPFFDVLAYWRNFITF